MEDAPSVSSEPAAKGRQPEIAQWLRQAREGSNSALGRALEASRHYLLTAAGRALPVGLRSKAGASDLVQDTFADAQAGFGRFRGTTQEEFFGWLNAILKRRIANHARRYQGTQRREVGRELPLEAAAALGLEDSRATPATATLQDEERRRLRAALELLPDATRALLVERMWERKSFADIGAARNCSEEAARKQWTRALRDLQKILPTVR